MHVFTFNYSKKLNESFEVTGRTQEEIKSATVDLLKMIQSATKKLPNLSGNLYMTMKLQYYEEGEVLCQ